VKRKENKKRKKKKHARAGGEVQLGPFLLLFPSPSTQLDILENTQAKKTGNTFVRRLSLSARSRRRSLEEFPPTPPHPKHSCSYFFLIYFIPAAFDLLLHPSPSSTIPAMDQFQDSLFFFV
jgi:hypothetical protein